MEAPLLAAAHGRRAHAFRGAALAGMAVATAAAGLAPSYAALLAALALYGPASGVATNLAEAALVAGDPDRAERTLARWTLLGGLGDLAAPAVLAVAVALGLGFRGALLAVAALAAAQAAASLAAGAPRGRAAGGPGGQDGADGDPDASLAGALRAARSRPALLGWSAAAALCGLLDEVVVAFGALWLAAALDADATRRAAVLTAWMIGGIAGAALLERLAGRLRPATLLAASGLGCAAAYGAWLGTRSWIASAVLLGLAGLFAAAHHPLLRARAFAAMPERPHVVVAVGALAEGLGLGLPLLVGAVADAVSLEAALLVLLLQPAAVVVAAAFAPGGRR